MGILSRGGKNGVVDECEESMGDEQAIYDLESGSFLPTVMSSRLNRARDQPATPFELPAQVPLTPIPAADIFAIQKEPSPAKMG